MDSRSPITFLRNRCLVLAMLMMVSLSSHGTTIEQTNVQVQGDTTYETLTLVDGELLGDGGSLTVQNDLVVSSTEALPLAVSALKSIKSIDVGGDLVVDGAILKLSIAQEINVSGNVILSNGAKIEALPSDSDLMVLNELRFVVAGNVSVDSTSEITVSGAGYPGDFVSGPGYQNHFRRDSNLRTSCHAGWSSNRYWCSYGRYERADTAGNGGFQSLGGGVLQIKANDVLIEGGVFANGVSTNTSFSSGAAGGSIRLDAVSLSGSGEISASASARGSSGSAAGGGGRVAINVSGVRSFNGAIKAHSSTGGRSAGVGTIFIKDGAEGHGHLIANNSGQARLDNSTTIRAVGRRLITSVKLISTSLNQSSPDVWEVQVEGDPWRTTDIELGWGIEGIKVDLDASEDTSSLYTIESNTTNTLTIRTFDNLESLVGNELVGVHTFKTVQVSGGASLSFGSDKLFIEDMQASYVRADSKLKAAISELSVIEKFLSDGGIFETTEDLSYETLSFSEDLGARLVAKSLNVSGDLNFDGASIDIVTSEGITANRLVSNESEVTIAGSGALELATDLILTATSMNVEGSIIRTEENLALTDSSLSLKSSSGEIVVGGNATLTMNPADPLSVDDGQPPALINVFESASSIDVGGNLVFDGAAATFTIPEEIKVGGDLILLNGGKIEASPSNPDLMRLNELRFVIAGNVSVDSASEITASGAGYPSDFWIGPGYQYSSRRASNPRTACHGGRSSSRSNCSYGRYELANTAGNARTFSDGGGVLQIRAHDVSIEGTLSADGKPSHSNADGSAGGSIRLDVNSLSGSGQISASANAGSYGGSASGGGGRISIYADGARSFDGIIKAHSSKVGQLGGAGTIFIKDVSENYGHFIADNAGLNRLDDSTNIRHVGRHTVTSVNQVQPNIWEITVEGEPWRPTDPELGWGVDGIAVDLIADEDASLTYTIQSNTANVLTVNTADDLTGQVGGELVGVHFFKTIQLSGGASVDFGDDKLVIEDINSSFIKTNAKLKAFLTDKSTIQALLSQGGDFQSTADLSFDSLDFSNVAQGGLSANSLTVQGELNFSSSNFNLTTLERLTVGSLVATDSSATIRSSGQLEIDTDFRLSSSSINVESEGIQIGSDLGLVDTTLSLKQKNSEIIVGGQISLQTDSTISAAEGNKELKQLHDIRLRAAGDVTVDDSSKITSVGAGYPKSDSSGPDFSLRTRLGCHGGRAAASDYYCAYGRYEFPNFAGSAQNNVNGGGVLHLSGANLIIDGSIISNGDSYTSGSAGGSIYINAASLSGTGLVAANGGEVSFSSGNSGAGGRIAIYVDGEDLFEGKVQAHGGLNGSAAGAGTVYRKNGSKTHGSLLVDNAGRFPLIGSTRIRQVGRHEILTASLQEPGVWLITVAGIPWRPTDTSLGWGIDGIHVDLDADEELSALYLIESNTESSFIVRTTNDLSIYVGRHLVGAHQFESIKLSGYASVDFGQDKIYLNNVADSYIRSNATLMSSTSNIELRLSIVDRDEDGIPDVWEQQNGLNPSDPDDAALDRNNDGTSNLDEYRSVGYDFGGDDDTDGLLDEWEVIHGLDPSSADQDLDTDSDSLSNIDEHQLGTNPIWLDTDNDGSPDAEEIARSTNPLRKDFGFSLSGTLGRLQSSYTQSSHCAIREKQIYCWGKDQSLVDAANHPDVVDPSKISLGENTACVLDQGKVKCWGHSNVTNGVAIINERLTEITDIDVGYRWACALGDGGNVQCWGAGFGGSLSGFPIITDAASISVGYTHACVIRKDSTVQCWGNNHTESIVVPDDLGKVSYIDAGTFNTCAIAQGRVRCWGGSQSIVPNVPTDITGATNVETSFSYACAATDSGPRCWGSTPYGLQNVPELTGVLGFSLGTRNACALSNEGVTCWGAEAASDDAYIPPAAASAPLDVDQDGIDDDWEVRFGLSPRDGADALEDLDGDGQSNLNEFLAATKPNDLDNDGLSDEQEVSIGTNIDNSDSDADGMPDGWEFRYGLNPLLADNDGDKDEDGLSNLEEFSLGTNPIWYDTDNDLSPDSEEVALSSNPLIKDFGLDLSGYVGNHCAIRDNKIHCWGWNGFVTNASLIPNVVLPSTVSVGENSACVVDQGEVLCWGDDRHQFLDDVTVANKRLGSIVDVGVGRSRACALDSSGKVFCWGADFDSATSSTPIITDAIALTVGYTHSCALKRDLSVACWGDNGSGESEVPSDLGPVSHIQAFNSTTCAVVDGSLNCWGATNTVDLIPSELNRITSIDASSHVCLVNNGLPGCWGVSNSNGQLNVAGFSDVRKYAVSSRNTCALNSQEVRCIGIRPFVPDELKDRTKPFDIRNLAAQTLSGSSVELTWALPAFNSLDIDTYEITMEGSETIEVPSGNLSYTIDSLQPGTVYNVSVVTRDAAGNKSEGASASFATAYANPSNLSGVGRSNLVDLSWTIPAERAGISVYRIYQSNTAFTDITGMQTVFEVNKNQTASSIGGLNNDADYFFAITSVNISGFESTSVTSVLLTPETDTTGPTISNATFASSAVVSGFSAANDAAFCVDVQDISKISRVEFSVDGSFVDSDSTANEGYCFDLRVSGLTDGAHQITVAAYDVFENVEPVNYELSVVLAPPAAPIVSSPQTGLVTNQQIVDVIGNSRPGLEVQATVNDVEGDWVSINATGQFSIPVFLSQQGDNSVKLRARNRSGAGAFTAPLIIDLDTSLPAKPIGLNAEARDNGVVSLSWSTGTGGRATSFEIYRSTNDVFNIPSTGKVNSSNVTSTSFNDLVTDDGTYYYKVVSVNEFGVRSEASLSTSINVDVTAPFAETIEYSTDGAYDATSDTYGRGNLSIALTVNEPLLTTPFLSISPDGGVPISVVLSQSDESNTVYTGRIILDDTVRSGAAYAVFSARDKAGNRGTNVSAGQQINIDTAGPAVVAVTTDPASPLKNDSAAPVTLTVAFNVDELLSASVAPKLFYSLSSSALEPQEANSVVKLADQSWQASISLPSNAGADQAETLSLFFEGEDNLGNRTESANPISTVQVYQGDLPALEAPFNFRGNAISGGRVQLEWFEVQQASAYKLYRKSETDADFTLLVELTSGESYTDQTPLDGIYEYQLSSIRSDNGEMAESARTAPISITTDSIAPAKPEGLTLELFPIGIQAEWAPVSEAGVTYQLFTAETGPITELRGLTPILEGLSEPFVVDTNASQSKPAYAVVAVDSIGNQSEPSETAYLNVDLLPVSSLSARLVEGEVPTISWSHSKPSIDSFDVFFGEEGQTVKLNDATISGTQYTDAGYSNESKTYSVVAIDVNSERSLPRFISLPKVSLEIVEGQQIKRNLINVIDVTLTNLSNAPISNATINLLSDQANFKSARIDLAANAQVTMPITIGGLESLPDLWQPSLELHSQPNAGDSIEIAKPISMGVRDGALGLSFETDGFIRGADGTVRLSIENSGDQTIQLITASNQGKSDSPDVLLSLRDEDNNVLSVVGMRQALGEGVVNNVAGEAILSIAAGESWQSAPITLPVPLNAPDTVFLSAAIRNMYAKRGTPEQVTVKGPSSRQQIVLTETPYRGVITSITPGNSFGRQPIVIKGQALERETDRLLSNVDLQIIISLNGFERSFEVLTDSAGEFQLSYESQEGESGVYKVSVLHPIQTSRPNSGEFVISRLTVSPSALNLRIPYDLAYNIPITFRAGEGTELNNLGFAVEASKQPNGQLPQGIEFVYPSIAKLTSLQRITENITITADNTADQNGEFVVSIYADESPSTLIGTVDVAYAFSEAKPALGFSPSILELGAKLDSQASGSITLENRGLAPLKDVRVTLKTADGFPAFDWIKLTTLNSLGDIAVGESAKADILLQPNNAAPTGVERFVLEVESSNSPTYQVPIVTSIVESGEGGILIKVTDMYSGTLNSVGQIIQGLNGANVRIQNESDPSIEFSLKADDVGEVLVEDIPAGRYSVWVSAPNYQEVHQRVRIQPGFIASEQIFLMYEVIKLEWTVNEIALQDRYEITLRATFETDVPAAVVMIEPTNIKLPPMEQGDVFYGELKMTNYGLIQAFDINFTPQQSDEFYQFEYLTSVVPEFLDAKEQVVVPYKVTALRSLEQQDATGGGCGVYTKCAQVECKSNCPTGTMITDSSSCVTVSYGTCDVPTVPVYRPSFGGGGGAGGTGGAGGVFTNDPLPQGGGFPKCRAAGGDCGSQRGGGSN